MSASHAVVPVRLRSALALTLSFVVGVVAFGWPFLIRPGAALDTSHSGDAPMVFVVLLPLLAAVVLAELASGGVDAKAVAMLGMLAAVGGALRGGDARQPRGGGRSPARPRPGHRRPRAELRGDRARRPGVWARLRVR